MYLYINSVLNEDFNTFQKKVKIFKKFNFFVAACKIYQHRIALDSQKYINSVFNEDFNTSQKKVKIFKNFNFFVARVQNLPPPCSPRFTKIHTFCVLQGFWDFLEKSKISKKKFIFRPYYIYLPKSEHGKYLPMVKFTKVSGTGPKDKKYI